MRLLYVVPYSTNDLAIISALLKYDQTHSLLEYYDATTDYYQRILKWCDLNTNLEDTAFDNLLQTRNNISYSVEKNAFVTLNYDELDQFDDFPDYIMKQMEALDHYEIIKYFLKNVGIEFTDDVKTLPDDFFNQEVTNFLEDHKILSKPIIR
jgi:hypothetical protein